MLLANILKHKSDGIEELVGRASNQANAMVLLGKTLAESSLNVSEHADDQVQYTEEIAAAMEEMNSSIKEIAESAAQTTTAAKHMAELNEAGSENMHQLTGSIDDVARLFEKVTVAMDQLNATSDAVNKIVEVINQIASQTNLLSMNALIEAAHAGKHGKGFAVVADEVRNLAANTLQSTREITETIARNQEVTREVVEAIHEGKSAVEKSVEKSRETAEALRTVGAEVDTVATMIHQIGVATQEQSATVGNITTNIESVARLAQDTLTSATSSHELSNNLAKVAGNLENRVNTYKLDFFGLVPVENAIKMNKSFTALSHFLGDILGRRFWVRLGHDYDSAIEDVGSGRALLSYQTPSTYIEAHEKYGVDALAIPLQDGQPFYRSAIVVREDSGINNIADLKNRKFAFGDIKSTGSKAMPESMLKAADVTIDDLASHNFVGSHDNVANSVLNKDADAGGLMLSVAENYVGKGLKIIGTSEEIPQFPICASPNLSKSDKRKVVDALVNLKDERILKALGSKVTGFAPIKDSDYDGVRAMLKNLKN